MEINELFAQSTYIRFKETKYRRSRKNNPVLLSRDIAHSPYTRAKTQIMIYKNEVNTND